MIRLEKKVLIQDRTETIKQIALYFPLQIKHILCLFFSDICQVCWLFALATAKCNVLYV